MNHIIKETRASFDDKFIFLLYALYFIMKPFYFWTSGLPQISDIILTLLIISFLIKKGMVIRFDSNQKKFLLTVLIFVIYILFANTIWMLILNGSLKFIVTSAFYLYNFIIVLVIAAMYYDYRDKIIEVTYKATLVSLSIQIVIYLISGRFSGGRMIGGFNNPNQLGYYGLLSLATILFASQRINVKIRWFIFGILTSAILCFSSLSKAAMVSYIVMLLFFIFSNSKNKKLKKNFIIINLLLMITLISIYQLDSSLITSNEFYSSVQRRINSIGKDSDDSLEGRAYYRILEYPEYWILGAGEGEYGRFRHQSMEFHSTLGNIQVSYGIVGLSLFIGFMCISLKNDKFRSLYIIASIMAYGLTHNGIRNSMLWILIVLISSKTQLNNNN